MFKPVQVKALPQYKLWIEYNDGVAGEVDLSYLVGRGVFASWEDSSFFEQVYIGTRGEIAWSNEIDLCPDALYIKITGKSPEKLFPKLKSTAIYA